MVYEQCCCQPVSGMIVRFSSDRKAIYETEANMRLKQICEHHYFLSTVYLNVLEKVQHTRAREGELGEFYFPLKLING